MKLNKLLLTFSAVTLAAIATGCTAGTDSAKNNDQTQNTTTTTEKVDVNKLNLPQLSNKVADNEVSADIKTSLGTISVKLFPDIAPKAVENFMTHAREGYYDEVKFHRVMKDFMIQSGDPRGDGTGGESIWDSPFVPEISNQLYHINGALAMARSGNVTDATQGSQFYIVQNDKDATKQIDEVAKTAEAADQTPIDYPDKIKEAYKDGGVPFLDSQYSVFGQVIKGMDVVQKIADLDVEAGASGEKSSPTKDFRIESIKITKDLPKK